ncbi:hypothetical protein [Paraglaciecola sp. 25GB23A]
MSELTLVHSLCKAAGLVIQFPGAIIPKENFSELIKAQLLAFEHQAN